MRRGIRSFGFAGYLFLLTLGCPLSCVPQEKIASGAKGDFLPPTTGEALTVAAADKPDVSCSVVEWTTAPPKPTLTLLCPPEEVFAPLHVYLKISWLKPEDVPAYARKIDAPTKTHTKLRTNKTAVWVWLAVPGEPGRSAHERWVGFTGVVDMALLSLPGKH